MVPQPVDIPMLRTRHHPREYPARIISIPKASANVWAINTSILSGTGDVTRPWKSDFESRTRPPTESSPSATNCNDVLLSSMEAFLPRRSCWQACSEGGKLYCRYSYATWLLGSCGWWTQLGEKKSVINAEFTENSVLPPQLVNSIISAFSHAKWLRKIWSAALHGLDTPSPFARRCGVENFACRNYAYLGKIHDYSSVPSAQLTRVVVFSPENGWLMRTLMFW